MCWLITPYIKKKVRSVWLHHCSTTIRRFRSEKTIEFDVNLDRDRGTIYDLMLSAKKEHSLQAMKPHLAKLWHPIKNGSVEPSMIGAGSSKKCWWMGPCGHEWQSAPDYLDDGSKCPFCYGTEVLSDFNDLETKYPDIAKQWNYEKNMMGPSEVTSKSNRNVWWTCDKGHEWQSTVARRVKNKAGCPFCSKQKLLPGFNDLLTVHPQIASEWHPVLNGYLQPWEVIDGSKLEIWWMCDKGHEWKVDVNTRTNLKSGCPICSRQHPKKSMHISESPELIKQWHTTKNTGLDPSKMSVGCHTPVWWICDKGHEWKAPPHGRRANRGCPVCAGKTVLEGYNDLQYLFPAIAKEWNLEKNQGVHPDQVLAGSKKKYWWICEMNHEWQAMVSSCTR